MKTLPFAKMSAPIATCRTVFLLARMGLIEGLDGFDPTKEAKVISPPMPRLTVGKHQRLMGNATKALLSVIEHGGSKDEVLRVAKYAMIVQDALKYQLDTYDAYMRLGIEDIVKKYNLYSPY